MILLNKDDVCVKTKRMDIFRSFIWLFGCGSVRSNTFFMQQTQRAVQLVIMKIGEKQNE
jgi:hypothetical protein